MNSTDFMLWGEAETSDTGGISQCQLRNALLPHNPRRCLVQPVLLTSNNRKESRFVTPSDLTSSASKLVEDATAPSALGAKTHGCTDFITIGYVEGPAGRGEPVEGVAQLPIAAASSALLHRPHKTRPVTLTSNNAKCEHFVVDGYCSAPLTSQDVLWMETVAQVKPGVLFKRFSEAASEPPSSCELPYDPMKRYNALNKTKSLKLPKGHKSPEHLENLRKSDPLINLWAWHDYNELHAKHINTRAARVHQQALIDRAIHAHARLTDSTVRLVSSPIRTPSVAAALDAHRDTSKAPWWANPKDEAPSPNALKRAMLIGRLKSVDGTNNTGERTSSDSVIAHLGGTTPPASPKRSDGGNGNGATGGTTPPTPPPQAKWQKTGLPPLGRLATGHTLAEYDDPWPIGTGMPLHHNKPQRRTTNPHVEMPPMFLRNEEAGEGGNSSRDSNSDIDTPGASKGGGGKMGMIGERSPTSVTTALAPEFEKDFPPLSPSAEQSKKLEVVDKALGSYKIVSGPGWYSDS